MSKKTKNLAWHFVGDTLRDGSPIPPDGEWLIYSGQCKICESGLHASRNPFDALRYAPGAVLCLVEIADIVDEQDDKLLCRKRRIVARMDATELCSYFARMQAISCLDNLGEDPAQIILEWLFTGDEASRSAAASEARAAWSAARSAEWSAWSAARSAESAARAAAWSASSAARSEAWSAARSAAWSAARSEAWSAARAAWSEARAAAESASRDEFTQFVYECFEDYL